MVDLWFAVAIVIVGIIGGYYLGFENGVKTGVGMVLKGSNCVGEMIIANDGENKYLFLKSAYPIEEIEKKDFAIMKVVNKDGTDNVAK